MQEVSPTPSRSMLELIQGAWRLPGIAFLLAAYKASIFIIKTPVPQVLEKILVRRSETTFHNPTYAEQVQLGQLWRLSTLCLNYLFFSSKPCLCRCLFLLRWCCKRGIHANLVIGVAKDGAVLKGHSWIELEGTPFYEDSTLVKVYQPLITASSKVGISFNSKKQMVQGDAFPLC